jgi:putative ABC transport system permease protein
MFKTNLLLAYRSLMKEKGFTLINTIGLALGLACFILIMVYVIHEHSYEKFRPDYERTYRVYQYGAFATQMADDKQGFLPFPMSGYIAKNYPEVENVVTIDQNGGAVITYKENAFQEWRALNADSNFFSMFPAEFIAGDYKTALNAAHKLVLTETAAKKWFGNENPIGKMMKVGSDSILFEVSAVVKDPRTDTHIKYSMLLSDQSVNAFKKDTWLQCRYRYIYVKLKKGTSVEQFEKKLQPIVTDKLIPEMEQLTGKPIKETLGNSKIPEFKLQRIQDIHLDAILRMEVGGVSGNKTLVSVAGIIAFAILILACINFINLSTARFSNRMKEICVKKTVGSSRTALFIQFMSESYLLTFIAIIFALAITELTIKTFCDTMQLEYVISFYKIHHFVTFILFVFIVVGLLSGAYPALIMSNTTITDGLRGKFQSSRKGSLLRKSLVVMQFIVSFTILLGAFVISKQLNFIFADDKGYTRENLVVLHNLPDIKNENTKAFKEELQKIEGVKAVAFTNIYPTDFVPHNDFWKEEDASKTASTYVFNSADFDFVKTMKLTIMKGRDFNKNIQSDTLAILINETAAKYLGYKNPIGKRLVSLTGDPKNPYAYLTIIGIVKDYNILPVYKKIDPLVLYANVHGYQNVLVRISGDKTPELMSNIKTLWKKYSNGNNLATENMQEVLDWQYRNEVSAQKIITTFSIICILIASLGLIGLVSYSTLRRTKEIGIRKANGAEVWQILFSLSKDTMILIGIAVIIALPISYFVINGWLKQFAYHVDITAVLVVFAIVCLYLIALISEVALTLKAARQNPIKALRYE